MTRTTAPATTPSPWVLAGSPTALGDPTSLVTLVDGQTFCLSSRSGDFDSNPAHGVYFADMRVLSRAHLRIGGMVIEPLAVQQDVAETATFVGRCALTGISEGNLLVVRRRHVGNVWHEQIEVRNFSPGRLSTVVELEVAADFADVFAIKEGPRRPGRRALRGGPGLGHGIPLAVRRHQPAGRAGGDGPRSADHQSWIPVDGRHR